MTGEDIHSIVDTIMVWSKEHAVMVLGVLLGTWLLSKFMKPVITRVIRRLVPRASFASLAEEKQREDTLIDISYGFFSIFIWVAAFLIILDSVGVPIAPLITGAGIIGVAVGFGSQSLVKDVITGLFIIAENQFRIGDVIEIGNYHGTVEGMTLRVTKLRQLDGTIHYVPNGEIKVASNKSMDYSMVDMKVDVGYNTKIDYLEKVINQVGEKLAEDKEFGMHILEAPKFLRVDDFSDYAITVRILSKVYPKQQYLIAGELRRRLKKEFEQHSIDIPYPTRVVYNVEREKNEDIAANE